MIFGTLTSLFLFCISSQTFYRLPLELWWVKAITRYVLFIATNFAVSSTQSSFRTGTMDPDKLCHQTGQLSHLCTFQILEKKSEMPEKWMIKELKTMIFLQVSMKYETWAVRYVSATPTFDNHFLPVVHRIRSKANYPSYSTFIKRFNQGKLLTPGTTVHQDSSTRFPYFNSTIQNC